MAKKNKNGYSFFDWIKGMIFGANSMGKPQLSVLEEEQMQSPMRTIVRNFVENKVAMTAAIVFIAIFAACFIFPVFYPLDLNYGDVTQQNVGPGFNMMSVPKALENNLADISSGSSFGVGADKDGKVYVFGNITEDKLNKIPENMGKIVDVEAGHNHIVALNDQGKVFTWGYDRFNLGKVPLDVTDMSGEIVQIGAGYQISYVLSDRGEVIYWGNDNLLDISLSDVQKNVEKIVFNTSTAMVITKDTGEVKVLCKTELPIKNVPAGIKGAVDIAITEKAAAAVTPDGTLYIWGTNTNGELDFPQEIQGNVAQIEGGRNHFTALTKDGKVYSWGLNNYGQTDVPSVSGKITEIKTNFHQNYAVDENGNLYKWGLKGYLMGTDGSGRDIFTRLVAGGRMTMTVGAIAVIISAVIGVLVGGISGYYGGLLDDLLMRLAEIVGSLPFLPFAMILSTIVGNKVNETQRIAMIMVILGVLSWPGIARLVRAQILAEREKEFVTAAKAMGINEMAIIFRHILPNVITVVIVNVTLSFASSMLTESTLSFIGFGVIEPNPTWGNMLKGCQDSKIISDYWWRWVFPALALSLSTISINIIGEGLRQAIDPKSQER